MNKEKLIRYLEIAAYTLIVVVAVYGFYFAGKGQEAFLYALREDGWVENLTVLFLLVSCGVAIYRARDYYLSKANSAFFFWGMVAFLFFFAAGEEISWGQRIFDIETPEFFQNKNLQNETNLHNLVIGDVKINKLIFSQLLFGVMAIYLILLRPLAGKILFINNLTARFQVPLARWVYVGILVFSAFAFLQINLMKDSELTEFVFATIFMLIFINPILLQEKKIKSE